MVVLYRINSTILQRHPLHLPLPIHQQVLRQYYPHRHIGPRQSLRHRRSIGQRGATQTDGHIHNCHLPLQSGIQYPDDQPGVPQDQILPENMAVGDDGDDFGEGDVDQHRIQLVGRGRDSLQGDPARLPPLHPHLPTLLRISTLPHRQQLRTGRILDEEDQ